MRCAALKGAGGPESLWGATAGVLLVMLMLCLAACADRPQEGSADQAAERRAAEVGASPEAAARAVSDSGPAAAGGEVLVRFRPDVDPAQAQAWAARRGFEILRTFPSLSKTTGRVYALLGSSLSTEAMLRVLKEDQLVENAFPNFRRQVEERETD